MIAGLPAPGLVDALPAGVLLLEGERCVYANEEALRILGRRPDELDAITPELVVEPEDRATVWARLRARLRGEHLATRHEFTVARPDGSRTRVEYEARLIGPGRVLLVVRDVGDRARGTALLVHLGELAAEVQRGRSEGEILGRVCAGLSRLGFRAAVVRVAGTEATVSAVATPAEATAPVEALLGRPLSGLVFPVAHLAQLERAIAEGRPSYLDDAIPALLRLFGHLGVEHPDLPRLLEELTGGKLVIVPLRIAGLSWGALVVGAGSLTGTDAAAFPLFAGQVAASLEVAESLELLARRNRELGAITALARAGAPAPENPDATGEAPRGGGEAALVEAEAARRIRFLSTLWDLGRAGSEARAVGPLAARVLERLDEALSLDAAAIHTVEDGHLVLAGPRFGGWEPVSQEEMRTLRLDDRELPGLAVAERRTVTEELPGVRRPGSLASRLGAPHAVTVPLLAQDRAVGALTAIRRGERAFSAEEVQLLEICAAQVAVALEHARLFEQKRRRVRDLSLLNEMSAVLSSQLELPAILATGVRYLGQMFEDANVFLVLREGDDLRVAASSVGEEQVRDLRFPPDGPSAAAEVVRTLRPVIFTEIPEESRMGGLRFGHRSLMAVPLVFRGGPIGAVVLGNPHVERAFTRPEVERVTPVASAIAAAVVNARLFAEERRRAEQARLLLEVGRTITATLELERILEASARTLAQMVDATTAHIFLVDAGSRTLRGAATSAARHRSLILGAEVHLDEPSVAARSVATRAPVAVPDTSAPDASFHRRLARALGERSVLGLPLLVRDEPIGAVIVGDVRGPRRWTDAEIERASLVAHQVAVAVANARLFDDLRRSYAELARTQEELVKRERLAALGELSAVVAHEVRNPLGVIFNALGPLRRLLQPTGDARMLLDIVGEEADRLNRIVSDLLDFARPHVPSLEPESLPALLEDVLAAVRGDPASARVSLVADLSAALPPVRIDARMMRRALLNVVQNAVQAMPKGGTVRVASRREEGPAGPVATVEVTDEGPGVPAELLAQIFQPFFTTKATGTGLGLAVVKGIVEAHRGEVGVASPPGGGTTFTIRLPLGEAT